MKDSALLTLIIFMPTIGALILGLSNSRSESWMRSVGNFFTALTFALTLFAWWQFDSSVPGMQMASSIPWISAWNVNYSLGVARISLPLVLLTRPLRSLPLLPS